MRMKTRFMRKRNQNDLGGDPMDGVGNLFDVAMIFSVGLMLAIVIQHDLPELISAETNATIVKNPGTPDMEIIMKEGEKLDVKKITNESLKGVGKKLGTTYVLENGDVIYVPVD
jgi:hypothetical protein